jgi:hypothetical protein
MTRRIPGRPLCVDCATAFYSEAVGADALIWPAVLADWCALPMALEVVYSLIAIVTDREVREPRYCFTANLKRFHEIDVHKPLLSRTKDVKTSIAPLAEIRKRISNFRALVFGPTTEDPAATHRLLMLLWFKERA